MIQIQMTANEARLAYRELQRQISWTVDRGPGARESYDDYAQRVAELDSAASRIFEALHNAGEEVEE